MTTQEAGQVPETLLGPHAIARIGPDDVPYSRSGKGTPLLLLVGSLALRHRLQATLDNSFKVYAPDLEGAAPAIATEALLRGMIDGLGLGRPHLVAAGMHGLAALHFAASDPERVDRVALLWRDIRTGPLGAAMLEERLAFTSCPLLLVCLGEGADGGADDAHQFAAIARFLGQPIDATADSTTGT